MKYEILDNKLIIKEAPKILNEQCFINILNGLEKQKICFIELCEGIIELNVGDFFGKNFPNLNNIILPNSLKEIGRNTFYNCKKLTGIIIPEGTIKINSFAFSNSGIEKIQLSSTLKEICSYAFKNSKLKEIVVPEGITRINYGLFHRCNNLLKIELPNSIKEIIDQSFYNCQNLNKIIIPEGVVNIERLAFFDTGLEEIELPNTLKQIGVEAFAYCKKLTSIVIPENVENISSQAFFCCSNLKRVHLPKKLRSIGFDAFSGCINLDTIVLKNDEDELEINISDIRFVRNKNNMLFLYDSKKKVYGFYNNGRYIEFERDLLSKNRVINSLIRQGVFGECDYINLYYWHNKKFIPNYIIIDNMPIDEIDNFYINNNCKEWRRLLDLSNIKNDENIGTFFKLCYVLGLFNVKASVRNKAIKFIEENIIGKMCEEKIHERFDGFDLNIGFNEEYSEFFMKYYNDNFMKVIDKYDGEIDLIAASYNNFSNVKKFYPNKSLDTNKYVDMLLPQHVINAVTSIKYENVRQDNEELAELVGKYGYSQEQFEKIQDLFNIGKSINTKLFIKKDDYKKISYNLLEKDNPLTVVLGNITNCCQVIGGIGKSCVKYGVTQPNSKFMVFDYDNTIIGQSWVWYDEKTKTICLDNIEVPTRYCKVIKHDESLQKEFIDCLLRVAKNFKEEMKKHKLEVQHLTIGKGYNDIRDILDKEFNEVENASCLSDYYGYRDSKVQYEISYKIK